MADNFRGDNTRLCESIDALLSLDASGSLVPHGIGGHARTLLESAATRLRALSPAGGDVWEVEAGGSAEHPQYWLHRNGRAFFNFGYGEDAELLAKSMARALNRLAASPRQSPAGDDWVMVPREPTPEMRAAGERERISRPTNMNPYHVWVAMLAASPQQEPGAPHWGNLPDGFDDPELYPPTPADESGAGLVGIASIPPRGDGATTRALFDARTVPPGTKLYASGQTLAGAGGLTFDAFRKANVARCVKWHPEGIASWSPSDWLTAVTGELGELASLIKMRNRERDGLAGNKFSPTDKMIADELADVVTYLDLLAEVLGVDLDRAAAEKFNEVSERVGFTDRITLTATSAGTTGDDSEDAARLPSAQGWLDSHCSVASTDWMRGWDAAREALDARRAREVG